MASWKILSNHKNKHLGIIPKEFAKVRILNFSDIIIKSVKECRGIADKKRNNLKEFFLRIGSEIDVE